MAEARVFWVAIWGKLKQGFAAPDRVLSSSLVAVGLLALTIGLVWFSALSIDKPAAQIIIYFIALLELMLGLRVGMLRIGYRNDEYMISPSSRFWRRAINYLVPAIFLPLPLLLAVATNLAGLSWVGLTIGKALVLNALMFFAFGVLWGVLIRRLTRRLFVRAVLIVMSVIAIFATVNTNMLIFDATVLLSSNYSSLLTVIIFELSAIVLMVTLTELLIGGIILTNRPFGRFYPLLLSPRLSGSGPGSTAFYLSVKALIRDSLIHRRLAAIIFIFIITVGLLYSYANFLGPASIPGLILSLFAVFSGAAVFVVAQSHALRLLSSDHNLIATLQGSKIRAGSFLGGLFWIIVISSVLWGIIDLTFGASQWVVTFALVIVTQFVLASGWSKKLAESHHQTLSTLTVYGMIILIGLVPALLWGATTANQTVFIQLIWLMLTVILLQLTNIEQRAASND